MKIVLKASMLLLVALFITQTAVAQKGDFKVKKEERGAAHLEKMAEELELTDEQVAKLKEIRAAFGAKKKAVWEKAKNNPNSDNREENKKAFKEIGKEYKAAVEKVLTPAQIEKQKAIKAAHKEKMAARKAEMKEMKTANKEKMKEVRAKTSAYAKQNILPVVLEQRAKLDKKMSRKDRKEVDRLRTEMKKMKPQMMAMRKAMKEAKKEGNATEAQLEKAKALKTKMHETIKAAKVIADKYETQITTLRTEVSDKEKQWKTDLKKIAEDAGLEKPERGRKEHHGKKGHHGMKGGKKHHRGGHGKMGMMKIQGAGFILLDPDMDTKEIFQEVEPTVTKQPAVKIYPNPASVANTLEFETTKAGKVTIEIRNKDGVLVRTIKDEHLEAGKHSVQVNLGDLNEYVYYYVIRDETGQRTKKFVIRK